MSKPSELPEWASDGAAITSPAPSAGKKTAGFVPDERPPANWWNWLFNRIWQWCAYLSNLHNEPEFLNKTYLWTGTQSQADLRFPTSAEGTYSTPRTRVKLVPLTRAVHSDPSHGKMSFGGAGELLLRGDGTFGAVAQIDLAGVVPNGAWVTRIRTAFEPSGAVSASNQVNFTSYLANKSATPTDNTIGSIYLAVVTGGSQIKDSGALSEQIDEANKNHRILLGGGDSNATDAKIRWIEITYTEARATGSG